MSATIKKHFNGLIGQSRTVERVSNMLANVEAGGDPTSVLITGRTGLGKDEMTGRIASCLNEMGYTKHEFACPSEITGKPYAKIAEDLDCGAPIVVHIGEAHRLKKARVELQRLHSFIMAWTDDKNVGKEISINDGELRATVNRRNCVFVMNTNFPAKLEEGKKSTSFSDRLLFNVLDDYTVKQLDAILTQIAGRFGLRINPDTLHRITECARGTARPLVNICKELRNMAAANGGKATLNREEVLTAIRLADMFPKGLTKEEVTMLQFCGTPKRDSALSSLFPNLENQELKKSVAYLQTCQVTKKGEVSGFLERSTGGLKVSSFGLRYLDGIQKAGFTLPA